MTFIRPVDALSPGDHACLIYDDEERRDEILASYVSAGLGRAERVICLSDTVSPGLAERLEAIAGPGQLSFLPASKTFLPEGPGSFTPDRVLHHWRGAIQNSVEEGFEALCAAGEPPQALTSNGSGHLLVDYERRANGLFATEKLVGLCLYDLRNTDARRLIGVVDAHPTVLYAARPDPRLKLEEPQSRRLVVSGWADITTLGGLADRLTATVEEGGDVEVDLERVDFVDIAALRLFVEAASRLSERGYTLTLARPPDWVPSVMPILGYNDVEGLVLE